MRGEKTATSLSGTIDTGRLIDSVRTEEPQLSIIDVGRSVEAIRRIQVAENWLRKKKLQKGDSPFSIEDLKVIVPVLRQTPIGQIESLLTSSGNCTSSDTDQSSMVDMLLHDLKTPEVLLGITGMGFFSQYERSLFKGDESKIKLWTDFVEKYALFFDPAFLAHQRRVLQSVQTHTQEEIKAIEPIPLKFLLEDLSVIFAGLNIARPSEEPVSFSYACADDILIRNEAKIYIIIYNLCKNAFKVMNPTYGVESPEGGGKIVVKAITHNETKGRDSLEITVSDNGPGIDSNLVINKALEMGLIGQAEAFSMRVTPSKALPLIFKSGFSLGNSTGLGLAICRQNLKKIDGEKDGRIFVDSEIGKGTRFTITLPCAA
ncbi:MAG: ATP-binding protein [Patescibacteria group bacterium]|nr:ATP-binding protein [Patescibacteria group bacterium]